MECAGRGVIHATPKVLRHGFGIKAITSEVPFNMTQKWLDIPALQQLPYIPTPLDPEERAG
jgi:integrase/recombinase XerD